MKLYSCEQAWEDIGESYRKNYEVPVYPEGFRERLEGSGSNDREKTAARICLPEDQI